MHLRDLPGIQTVQHGTVEYDMVFGMFMACLFDDTTNAVAREEFQVGGGAKNDKPRSRARYEREFFDEQSICQSFPFYYGPCHVHFSTDWFYSEISRPVHSVRYLFDLFIRLISDGCRARKMTRKCVIARDRSS